MVHETRNFRPNREGIQLPGACLPHQGQIIADLYLDGKFVRSAVVADVGRKGDAEGYCNRANKTVQND